MQVATFATPFTAELDSEWKAYKMTHNKQYQTHIEPFRFGVLKHTHCKLGLVKVNLIYFKQQQRCRPAFASA